VSTSTRLRLPEIYLPKYGGQIDEDFDKFLASFEAILEKHNLSEHERFVHLVNQLYGPPKKVVSALDPNEQSYCKARDILNSYFFLMI